MKLESQVVSSGLAQKLKSLGVKQESLYFWCDGHLFSRDSMYHSDSETYSAFTVAELGEITREFSTKAPYYDMATKKWMTEDRDYLPWDTQADAYADWATYLIENKLISV